MSQRQNIVNALKSRLQSIMVAGGYSSNLGSNVYEWRVKPLENANMPAIVFRDVRNSRVDGAIGRFTWALSSEIQIITSGSTAASDIRGMIADVYKAIGTDDKWGGLAITTEQPDSDEIDIEHTEKVYAGALIRLSILYATSKWEM